MQPSIDQLQDNVNVLQATLDSATINRQAHQQQARLQDAEDQQRIDQLTAELKDANTALAQAQPHQ